MAATPPIHRVLVLDDDEIMRELLQVLLAFGGYEIVLAGSGDEALDILRVDHAIEVVLTDLHMPGLEGPELALTLRATMPRFSLLIGMSGSEPVPEIRPVLDGFLAKPFDVQLFRNAVVEAYAHKVREEEEAMLHTATDSLPPSTMIAPLDLTIFHSLRKMISSAQLSQLFALALADIAKRHERIQAAAAVGDLPSAQREAHAIKGSCGMIGAAEIQALAACIEDGTTLDTSAVAEIPAACVRLKRMLETKLLTA